MNEKKTIIKNILSHNKWFIIPAILVLYISSAVLMMVGSLKLYYILIIIYENITEPGMIDHTDMISAHFLNIMENYILAIVFYILAISIYKLFVGNSIPQKLVWIKVDDINDLKSHLSKMIVLFLCTIMVQKVTEWQDPLNTMYFSIIVAVICSILIWYSSHLDSLKKRTKKEQSELNH